MSTIIWEARHLYYEGAANPLLQGGVLPLVRSLGAWPAVRGFFFVRYGDSEGPHLRLRFGLAPEGDPAAAGRQLDRAIAQAVRGHALRSVAAPFEPEVERYGGAANLHLSLEFFSISSAFALAYLQRYGDRPRNRQLPLALCVLLWQAWGFARDAAELAWLVQYEAGDGTATGGRDRADEIFDGDPRRWTGLVDEQLATLVAGEAAGAAEIDLGSAGSLAAATRLLAGGLTGVEAPARVDIGASHLHMTANRLGLSNWEECFAARMLYRALSKIGAPAGTAQGDLDRALARACASSQQRTDSLSDLISRHFMALEENDADGVDGASPGDPAEPANSAAAGNG